MEIFQTLPFLSILVFLPSLGALFILSIRGGAAQSVQNARNVALFIALITFLLSLVLWQNFSLESAEYQYVENYPWIVGLNIQYFLGVDGISLFFVILTAFLTPLCILASWKSIQSRIKEYLVAFLFLETFILGMFCALDLVLFYVFFEAVLIPMFLIIGIWGGERRVYASFKFFLYTLTGSVLMLLAILFIYFKTGTSSIPDVSVYHFDPSVQIWLWLAFFAAFAVKIPMFPFHTWLPDAHVEAPTAGSVILAGILLKMGGYGFLRISLPFFPEASEYFAPFVWTLSVIAIVYTSLIALAQTDMKKLIAYSSVAHMGFVTLGIFTFEVEGVQGALIQMLSHGVISAALFLCIGVLYDREHSREISHYGGIAQRMPLYATVFMVVMLGSIGLPGTSGFIGEFLVLVSAFEVNTLVATLAAVGMVLGAAYMLWLYRRIFFEKNERQSLQILKDLSGREIIVLTPLVIMTLWMGIAPGAFTDVLEKPVAQLLEPWSLKKSHTLIPSQSSSIEKRVSSSKNLEAFQKDSSPLIASKRGSL